MTSYEAINAANIVLGVQSTTGHESILLNTPFILLQWEDIPDLHGYIYYKVVYPVSSPELLYERIRKLLNDTEYRSTFEEKRELYLQEKFCLPLGESGNRCINLIDRIINEPNTNVVS